MKNLFTITLLLASQLVVLAQTEITDFLSNWF